MCLRLPNWSPDLPPRTQGDAEEVSDMVLDSNAFPLSFNVIQWKDQYRAQGEQSLIPISYDFRELSD